MFLPQVWQSRVSASTTYCSIDTYTIGWMHVLLHSSLELVAVVLLLDGFVCPSLLGQRPLSCSGEELPNMCILVPVQHLDHSIRASLLHEGGVHAHSRLTVDGIFLLLLVADGSTGHQGIHSMASVSNCYSAVMGRYPRTVMWYRCVLFLYA